MSEYWNNLNKEEKRLIASKFFIYGQHINLLKTNSEYKRKKVEINLKNLYRLKEEIDDSDLIYTCKKMKKLPIKSFKIHDDGIEYDDQSNIEEDIRKLHIVYQFNDEDEEFVLYKDMNDKQLRLLAFALGADREIYLDNNLYLSKEYICNELNLVFNKTWGETDTEDEGNSTDSSIKVSNKEYSESDYSEEEKVIIRKKKKNYKKNEENLLDKNLKEEPECNDEMDNEKVKAAKILENKNTENMENRYLKIENSFNDRFDRYLTMALILSVGIYMYIVYVLFGIEGIYKVFHHFITTIYSIIEIIFDMIIDIIKIMNKLLIKNNFDNNIFNMTNITLL